MVLLLMVHIFNGIPINFPAAVNLIYVNYVALCVCSKTVQTNTTPDYTPGVI